MAVYHDDGVGSPLYVLEELNDEYAAVVGADHHAREVRGHVEGLVGNLLVAVEEAVLVPREVVLGDKLVQVQDAVGVLAGVRRLRSAKDFDLVYRERNSDLPFLLLEDMLQGPSQGLGLSTLRRGQVSIEQALLAKVVVRYCLRSSHFLL